MLLRNLNTTLLSFAPLLAVGLPQTTFGNEIAWSTDIEGSLRQAAENGQPVLLEFTAEWCVYCKRMEKTTFVNPDVINYINERYVAVRVDADQNKQLVADLGVAGLPAILIVSPDLKIMKRIKGFQTPQALLMELSRGNNETNPRMNPQMAARTRGLPLPTQPTSNRVAMPQPAQQPAQMKPVRQELAFEPIETPPVVPARKPAAVSLPQEFEEEAVFEPVMEEDTVEDAGDFADGDLADAESATTREEVRDQESVVAEAPDDDFFATVSRESKTVDRAAPRPAVRTGRPPETLDAPEFEGNCLVSAVENREIVAGTSRHQTKYRGHVLYFSSDESKQAFLAQPGDYWPMFDGICAVSMLNEEERVPGKLEFAAFFRKRLWLFSSEENMQQFLEDPADVAEEMQELVQARSGR